MKTGKGIHYNGVSSLAKVALKIFGRNQPADEIKYHVVDNFGE
jgi:hypothetical protein